MVSGSSPLGYLRSLRVCVFFIPMMSGLVLAMGGRRFNGAYINPQSLTEMQPLMLPLFAGTAIIIFILGSIRPTTPMLGRMLAICVTYVLALVAFWCGVIYSLAGASVLWAFAGFVLAILAVTKVSLGRLASDVSGAWTWW
jgi:hypothetical protein